VPTARRTLVGRRFATQHRSLIPVLVAAVMLVACGTDTGPDNEPTTTAGETTTSATTAPGPTATIRITQVETDCCYSEGQVSFLELSGNRGSVLSRGFVPAATSAVLAEVTVEPGTYALESWQRPCEGMCPSLDDNGQPSDERMLDPPVDRCAGEISVTADETTNVLITWAPGDDCAISFPATQPSSDVPDAVALRQPYPSCGTDFGLQDIADQGEPAPAPRSNDQRRCFYDAYVEGREAELEAYEPTDDPELMRRLVYRLDGDGQIDVFYEDAPDWTSWFHYTCTGLEEAPTGYEFETVGCTIPEPLE
jgi:hypothetical protein